jgi:hypothetical protein
MSVPEQVQCESGQVVERSMSCFARRSVLAMILSSCWSSHASAASTRRASRVAAGARFARARGRLPAAAWLRPAVVEHLVDVVGGQERQGPCV